MSRRKLQFSIVLSFLLASAALFKFSVQTSPAYISPGAEYTVCSSGCDFDSIQVAVDSVDPGDQLDLSGETFTEPFTLDKSLIIQGAGAETTIIQAAASSGIASSRVVTVTEGVVATIGGVTIRYGNAESSSSDGGGILNLGSLTVRDAAIHSNISEEGGGIYNEGTLSIYRCSFNSNRTTGNGGGISNAGVASIVDSAFYDNQAELNGGGVYNLDATLIVNNSTFSGNVASDGAFDNYGGGGISNMAEDGLAELTINNCTIRNNIARWGGGVFNSDGEMNVKNTIVAGNKVSIGGAGPNCNSSSAIATSYNLENGEDCGFTGVGDLQNTNPDTNALQDNGGPTWTHALAYGSPAVNAGSCTNFAGSPVTTDQRGVRRISPCDIGAYEYVLQVYLPLVMHNSP